MSSQRTRTLLDADQISRTLARIGSEIVERHPDLTNVHLVGIRSRGVPIAERIRDRIRDTTGVEVPVGAVADPAALDDPDRSVVQTLIAGLGDSLPVSAMSVDGTFETGTSVLEKRQLAEEIPVWDASLCIDCGKCAIVCPHAAIRMSVFAPQPEASTMPKPNIAPPTRLESQRSRDPV